MKKVMLWKCLPVIIYFLMIFFIPACSFSLFGIGDSKEEGKSEIPRIYVDQHNRLIVGEDPFFPIGIYWARKDAIEELSGYGFNVMYPFPWDMIPVMENEDWSVFDPDVTLAEYLDEAERCNVKSCFFIDEGDRYIVRNLYDGSTDYNDLFEAITPFLDHPAFLTYYLMDEPENHMGEEWARQEFIGELNTRLKSWDIHHPTMLINYNPDVFHLYAEIADILLLDLYPIPDDTVDMIGRLTNIARDYTGTEIPIWITVQAFGNPAGGLRAPTPEELRCMTYSAIVQGARGINFFRNSGPDERNDEGVHSLETWNELINLAGELQDLSGVFLCPESVVLGTVNVEARQFIHNGTQYIVAVNTGDTAVSEIFNIGSTVNVLYEERSITPDDGSFTDSFEAFEVHIYSLDRYVLIVNPDENESLNVGETVSVEIEAGGNPNEVILYADENQVDSDTDGSALFSCTWTPDAAGWYTISAKAVYSDGSEITSSNIRIAVSQLDETHTWNSWEIVMNSSGDPQALLTSDFGAEADIEFYEALDTDGVGRHTLFDTYVAPNHSDTINPVNKYWTSSTFDFDYPYIGISTTIRENSPPAPEEVYDLTAFPGSKYTVCAFICPVGGEYSLHNLAVRRLADWGYGDDESVTLHVFQPDVSELISISALYDMAWVIDTDIHNLGELTAGDRIYFALDMDIASSGDVTKFAWTLERSRSD